MYNNGQQQQPINQGTTTQYDYYRNDVPVQPQAPASAGGLEEMLFYGNNRPAENPVGYSQPVDYDESASVKAPQYAQQPAEVIDEDVYPSVTTMQYKKGGVNPLEDFRPEDGEETDKRYKITTKGKIIVAVYALVLSIVLLLIVLNTSLLKNMNAQISYQQSQITQLTEYNQALTNRLEYVMSDEVIEQKADMLGMMHD